jgi:hypothetical protein
MGNQVQAHRGPALTMLFSSYRVNVRQVYKAFSSASRKAAAHTYLLRLVSRAILIRMETI